MENPEPKLYQAFELSKFQREERLQKELDNSIEDPYDEVEIFEIIRHVNDP